VTFLPAMHVNVFKPAFNLYLLQLSTLQKGSPRFEAPTLEGKRKHLKKPSDHDPHSTRRSLQIPFSKYTEKRLKLARSE